MLQPPFYLPLKVHMFWVICFHPSHRLFSWLRNHYTVSLYLFLLMIRYMFGDSFKQFSLLSPDVNKNKGATETASWEWFLWYSTPPPPCTQAHKYSDTCGFLYLFVYLDICLTKRPVSQSCAIAKSENFWWATGQSNLAHKQLATTKASKVWVLYFGRWNSLPACEVWLAVG